jgi:hypothetical protein
VPYLFFSLLTITYQSAEKIISKKISIDNHQNPFSRRRRTPAIVSRPQNLFQKSAEKPDCTPMNPYFQNLGQSDGG